MDHFSSKLSPELKMLAANICILRRKLMSYGWCEEEVAAIILEQFLKLPVVDWGNAASTVAFYNVKDRYHVDAPAAELLLCLERVVPNLESREVGEYLLQILKLNSLAFGFDLADSSSQSNEPQGLHKIRPKIINRRRKHEGRDRKRVKECNTQKEGDIGCSRKRHHLDDSSDCQRKEGEKKVPKKRKAFEYADLGDPIQKRLRKFQ